MPASAAESLETVPAAIDLEDANEASPTKDGGDEQAPPGAATSEEEVVPRVSMPSVALPAAPSMTTPASTTVVKMIPLALIDVHAGTRMRVRLSEERIHDLAEAMREGAAIPPIVVYDIGAKYRPYVLSDGFYRNGAALELGRKEILAEVRIGTVSDAKLAAATANPQGSLPYTNADKRRAVRALLADEKWGGQSARWIGEMCGVSDVLVGKIKHEMAGANRLHLPAVVVGRDGKSYPAARANAAKPEVAAPKPPRWLGPPGAYWNDLQAAVAALHRAEALVAVSHPELAERTLQLANVVSEQVQLIARDVESAERGSPVDLTRLPLDPEELAAVERIPVAPPPRRAQVAATSFVEAMERKRAEIEAALSSFFGRTTTLTLTVRPCRIAPPAAAPEPPEQSRRTAEEAGKVEG